jgi:hypothetical protein
MDALVPYQIASALSLRSSRRLARPTPPADVLSGCTSLLNPACHQEAPESNHSDVALLWSGPLRCGIAVVRARAPQDRGRPVAELAAAGDGPVRDA